MAENRGYGSYQEWPPTDKASEPRYQPPADFYAPSGAWTEAPYIPPSILKQAEARVAAQKQFFKHLFIYLGVVAVIWFIALTATLAGYSETTTNEKLAGLSFALLVTIIGAIKVGYSYFLAFVWEKRTHQERVMQEVHKLVS